MKRTLIGIAAHSEPEQFLLTLESLRACTSVPYDLVVVPDGPDEAVRSVLASLNKVDQLETAEARGLPTCFNRLAAANDAELVVLLESGCRVGPGWLQRLLEGLASHPRNGLAGPSTNRCWNSQAVFPKCNGDPLNIARTAAEAAQRFTQNCRTLEPLYSLADFCYAVKREVIEDIGLADEGYGLGPCWEMDYNIRAARAGWRGVWVSAAFVWRAPATARHQQDEEQRFHASKHRYQEKFCGARLTGLKTDFRSHCRGDACPNFAPIKFASRWESNRTPSAIAVPPQPRLEVIASPPVHIADRPLVTCIMPTYNRRPFVAAAIRNFLRQDYPSLELLIVDDGTDAVQDLVPADARIRYLRLTEKKVLGDKRNFACSQARGDFIVHWDDDDWYPVNRVSRQVSASLAQDADVCGTSEVYYYEPFSARAWIYRYPAASRPWVAGNTLAYRKSFWRKHPFPSLQIGEDTRFVWASGAASICDLKDPALCVGRMHPGNTSRKTAVGSCWRAVPLAEFHRLLGSDMEEFAGLPGNRGEKGSAAEWPLVSCVMPTRNRLRFVRLALDCFARQSYPRRELIIVDDGEEDLTALINDMPDIRYVRSPGPLSIGAKRNLACQSARGEIIAHWDDDDWYAPERLSRQVQPLLTGEADLSGLESSCVLELAEGRFWTPSARLHERMFVGNVHGGTLVFRKSIFDRGARYPNLNLAEDAAFLRSATRQGHRVARVANEGLFVYVRHGANAWRFLAGQFLDSSGWRKTQGPPDFLPKLAEYQNCLNALV